MRTTSKFVIQRADPGLQFSAGSRTDSGQRLRQHIAVLERVAARASGVHGVLQKASRRPVNGTFPLRQGVGNRARPQA